MNLKILAFGIAKDIFGTACLEILLTKSEPTVQDLKNALELDYPRLKQLSSYMIAVNNEYSTLEARLDSRDEIAIIPPVSGG